MWKALLDSRTLDESDWRRHHRLLRRVLAAHLPALVAIALLLGHPPAETLLSLAIPAALLGLGLAAKSARPGAAVAVAAGLACCSALLVGLTGQEAARVHLLVVAGLVALYRCGPPTLAVVAVTLLGHGFSPAIAALWPGTPPFADPATLADPVPWALVHGAAVLLLAAVVTAQVRRSGAEVGGERDQLARRLTEVELGRRQFVAELLVNLARRAQGAVHRQLEILTTLQQVEREPNRLTELGALERLATRVRRNAENLLVLAGAQPPRPTGGGPRRLGEVVRAATAETDDPGRVQLAVEEQDAVAGHVAADLIHLLAELIDNALRFSPPDSATTVRSGPDPRGDRRLLTITDEGVGMPPAVLADANAVLTEPAEIDLSVSTRLGLRVVARLAQRHRIIVTLTGGATGGVVCTVGLPKSLLAATIPGPAPEAGAGPDAATGAIPAGPAPVPVDFDPVATIPLPRTPPTRAAPPGEAATADPTADPPPLPVRTPARRSILAATAPFAAQPGARRNARRSTQAGRGDGWAGWWDPAGEHPEPSAPPDGGADRTNGRTAPTTWVDPAPAEAAPASTPDTVAGLRKRVPLAGLAPRLRVPPPDAGPTAVRATGQAVETATALSRYQVSRKAATTALGEDAGSDTTGTSDPDLPSVPDPEPDPDPPDRAVDGVALEGTGADPATDDPADRPPPQRAPAPAAEQPNGEPTAGPVADAGPVGPLPAADPAGGSAAGSR